MNPPSWNVLTQQEIQKQNPTGKATIETTKHGYLYRDVFSAFRDSLKKKNPKKSHIWLAELCISGEVKKTWNTIVDESIQFIPFVVPSEMVRLYRRMMRMKEKMERKEPTDLSLLHMIHDSLIIYSWCKQQKPVLSTNTVKIMSKITVPQDPRSHRKAPLHEIHSVVQGTILYPHDPPSLMVGGHEVVHAVLQKDIERIRWWLSWVILWTPNDAKSRPRPHRISNPKYQSDWIWGLWDLVFALAQHMRLPKSRTDIIRCAHTLFAADFTIGNKKKRFPLLLLSYFICSTYSWKPTTLPFLSDRIEIGLALKHFYTTIMKTPKPRPLLRSPGED